MKRRKPKFRQSWINKVVLSLVISMGLVSTSFAAQFDAPYYDLQKKNKDRWAVEDKQINAKLAALEKKLARNPISSTS